MMRKLIGYCYTGVVLALAACSAPASIPPTPAASPAQSPVGEAVQTITPDDMYARIGYLASDALRGRDTPSQGLEAAAAYLVSEYRRLGLGPAGENGTFYQRYPFPLRRLVAADARVMMTGPGGEEMLEFGTDFYAIGGTRADLIAPLVFTGRSIADPPRGGVLRDKIALVVLPGSRGRELATERQRQAALAEENGAAAIIHILDPSWTEARIAEFAGRAEQPQRVLGDEIGFPRFMVSYAAAERMLAAADLDLDTMWEDALAGESVPLTVPGVTATVGAPLEDLDRAMAPNVAAVLPGSDPALRDEYVVLSAHMDHVGVGDPVNGDSIYNGADDDASGTSALLEVAEAFVSLPNPPKRSIIFLHVSGEEKGLLGSRWYSEHPTVPLEQIVANLNADMIGRNSPDSIVVIGKEYSSLGETVNAVAAEHPDLGLVVAGDIWPEERFFFRSDHFNFARKEVPALFFFAGVHECYHRPCDEIEGIDADKAARVARLIFYTTQAVANAEQPPVWDPEGLEEVRELTR